MKVCIWCSQDENQKNFKNKAHTIPKSMGGIYLCENVCDECNIFFGTNSQKLPSIEKALKETFNISRFRLLNSSSNSQKKGKSPWFKSEYFKVDFINHSIDIKYGYKLHSNFQENMALLLRRGIYKMFLEETERQFHNALNKKYDFIRQFARYGIGDLPVLYFPRKFPVLLTLPEHVQKPTLLFEDDNIMNYMITDDSFNEFELLGHVFSIASSSIWEIALDLYLKQTYSKKSKYFHPPIIVQRFNDIDLTLSVLEGR